NDFINEDGSLKSAELDEAVGGTPNSDLMAQARMSLSGIWGMSILGYVLYTVLVMSFSLFVFSSVFFVGVVSGVTGADMTAATNAMQSVSQIVELLVSGAFTVGFMAFFLGIAQEGEARLELLFVGFRRFWKSFCVYFFYSLFVLLWMLLLIIPGIIATFRYAMAFFIIADDEDCGALEAIRRSKEMMAGNKWKFFCLHWRFFGWALLAVFFTFGIGFLWLVPYMQTAFAKFYEDVK
ncbi:MAG: DUF975 family protein, partial [Pontiella sp.]|nr:DUF975 family protein [Pontiella sp.]